MKTLLIATLFAAACMAAPIDLTIVGFSNSNFIVTANANVPTALTFATTTISGLPVCVGPQAALCNAVVTITPDGVFDSGGAIDEFNLGLTLKYSTSSTWVSQGAWDSGLTIKSTGTYSATGYTPTPGTLNFSFQPPALNGAENFSASGTTVPEPGTVRMLGLGLGLIGISAWRKRSRR